MPISLNLRLFYVYTLTSNYLPGCLEYWVCAWAEVRVICNTGYTCMIIKIPVTFYSKSNILLTCLQNFWKHILLNLSALNVCSKSFLLTKSLCVTIFSSKDTRRSSILSKRAVILCSIARNESWIPTIICKTIKGNKYNVVLKSYTNTR